MTNELPNIYKIIEKDNGDLILKKIIIDVNMYNIEKNNDEIILKKKKNIKINDIEELSDYDFKNQ